MVPIHQSRIRPELFVPPSSKDPVMKTKFKIVSFASSPTKVVLLPETDEDELRSKWYSKQDYAQFKESNLRCITAMDGGKNGDATVFSRGLELLTPSALAHKKRTKLKVLTAVWNGQVRQWNEQNRIYDPVSIALACQQETLPCVQMAWTFGQLDQKAAMEEYRSMLFSNQINQSNNYSGGTLQNRSNNYFGGNLENQSNSCIGGDLQKGGGAPVLSFSNPDNIGCGEDLKKCPMKSNTLTGKRTRKSLLDGSSHGLQSPAKKLDARLNKPQILLNF